MVMVGCGGVRTTVTSRTESQESLHRCGACVKFVFV